MLGHGVVSDDLIAIHGEVPIRYQGKRLSENEGGLVGDEEGNRDILSLNPPSSSLNFSSSFRSSLEDLWSKCVKESSQKIQRMLLSSSSSLSLPPPPTLPLLTSSNSTSHPVPSSPPSLLLSSTETKIQQDMTQSTVLDSCHAPSPPEDSSLEEFLVPLVASLLFLKNADASLSPDSNQQSSPSVFLRDVKSFLLDKIREVYHLSPTMMMSLSQVYGSLLKLLFLEEHTVTTPSAAPSVSSGSLSRFPPPTSLSSIHQSLSVSRISRPTHIVTSSNTTTPSASLASSNPSLFPHSVDHKES